MWKERYSQNGVYGNDYNYTNDNNNGEGDDDHDDNNDDDDDDSDDDNDDNNDGDGDDDYDDNNDDDDDNDDLSVRVAGGSRGTDLNGSRAGGSLPVLSFPLLQIFNFSPRFYHLYFFFPVKSSSIAKKNLNI